MALTMTIIGFWILSVCLVLCLWHVARSANVHRGERRRARVAADELQQRLQEKRQRD